MSKGRLEAFSDGVVAILITIMILDLRMPRGSTLLALRPVLPHFLIYVLSFIFLGIYWSNHHHMFHAVHHVNGAILWANLHLLFWLSLVPLVTGWIGENGFSPIPTAAYGVVLLFCAIAYTLLQTLIIRHEPHAVLASAVGSDLKAKVSLVLYVAAVPIAFVNPIISDGIYVAVALTWLVPDRRIESRLDRHERDAELPGRPS
ncbi:MAG TPA: TMEM175 family protein [Thermoanaerobaculia bacterium]|nr:TMEM175 family protein [Thermoanaerobaculia bacterium]